MSKDDLRSQLHDPDYWLAPEPKRSRLGGLLIDVFNGIDAFCVAAVIVLFSVVGFGIMVWLLPGWAVLVLLWIGWRLAQRP